MDGKSRALVAIAKRQHGVVTDEQVAAVGYSREAIRWRRHSGEWTRVLPGVLRLFWANDTWLSRCQAAVLWGEKQGAALSHATAARLLQFDVEEDACVHFSTMVGFRLPRRDWCWPHRTVQLGEVVTADGFTVTSPIRTMVDLTTVLSAPELCRVMSVAFRLGLLTETLVASEARRLPQRDCRAARLRTALNQLVRG